MPARSSPGGWCAASRTGPRQTGCSAGSRRSGFRPINALVDITNYIAYDRGRPLHVYDADKLTGAIRARLGRKGEKFLALDGKTYEVDGDMCVIADDRARARARRRDRRRGHRRHRSHHQRVHRVGLFRSRTHRPHRAASSASSPTRAFRFERGVDPDFVVPGLELATDLVLQLCGGTPSKITVAGKTPKTDPAVQIRSRPSRALERTRARQRRDQEVARRARRRARRQGQARQGAGALLAPRHHRPCRPGRRGGAAGRRRSGAGDAHDARRGRGQARAHRGAAPAEADPAPARRARAGRGGDLVVRGAGARQTVRRRQGRAHLEQPDLDRACRDAALAACRV